MESLESTAKLEMDVKAAEVSRSRRAIAQGLCSSSNDKVDELTMDEQKKRFLIRGAQDHLERSNGLFHEAAPAWSRKADIEKRDECQNTFQEIESTVKDLEWKIRMNEAKMDELDKAIAQIEDQHCLDRQGCCRFGYRVLVVHVCRVLQQQH